MTIGQRIALLVVVVITSAMGLFAAYNVRARRAELLDEANAEAADIGSTLDVVLNEILRDRDLSELSHLPDEIARARRIYGLAIFDARDGHMIASRTAEPRRAAIRALAERAARGGRPGAEHMWFSDTETVAFAFPLLRRGRERAGAGVVLRDLRYTRPILRASRDRIVVAASVVALLTALIVFAAARRTLGRPAAELIAGVRRIGRGDLTQPIASRRRDEIGSIGDALDRMMADLGAARATLRTELEARIALEKSVEFERRLQHAQRLAAVGQLAASLAHEIGSPLHVIAGRARFAADRDDAVEMRQNLTVIAEQADRITRVVEQLLAVARPRAPRVERVELAPVARAVVELLGPQARQQTIALRIGALDPDAATAGDPDALQQVVFNLALNALQAQQSGGEVRVEVSAVRELDSLGSERPRAVIEVRDNGPGVPRAARDAIFEPFTTTKLGSGGTGLGLAVVREIVRQHAGTVKVSDNPDGGAVFRVSLPAFDEAQ